MDECMYSCLKILAKFYDFNFSSSSSTSQIFDETAQPGAGEGKKKKFPAIKGNFESSRVPRMWFGKWPVPLADCFTLKLP